MLGENDPEAYQKAADRVTADPDQEVWVVQRKRGDEWSVSAVFTSYDDAREYVNDLKDFAENCPEDSPEEYCRKQISIRHGSRKSPTKMFETYPPETERTQSTTTERGETSD